MPKMNEGERERER
jgi:hypothetical protein